MMNKIVLLLAAVSLMLSACANVAAPVSPTDTPSTAPSATASDAGSKGPTPTTSPQPTGTSDPSAPTSNETPPASSEGTPSPLDPLPGEENMVRGEAFVDSAEVILLESFPVRVNLSVEGNLPTPCHFLRAEMSEPDENGRIDVTLYSLTEPGVACIQVLQPFNTTIPLGSYPSGSYSVYVNGDEAGEFDV